MILTVRQWRSELLRSNVKNVFYVFFMLCVYVCFFSPGGSNTLPYKLLCLYVKKNSHSDIDLSSLRSRERGRDEEVNCDVR